MREPYDEYGNESEFGGIDWGALLGVQNDPVGGMMSAAQVIPQVIPQVAQQASGISSPVRGAGYKRLTNGQVLTRDQLQAIIDNTQAKTGATGTYTIDQLLDKFSNGSGIGAHPAGWERGMTDEQAAALGAPDMGQFFDVAGDDYQTPEGGYGDGRGDAGYHYKFKSNPDGTYTVLDDGDYSGSFTGQQADRRSAFNLGDFGTKLALSAALATVAPQLAAQLGGGLLGGAGAGAITGTLGGIATDSNNLGRAALLGGALGGVGGYASRLNGGFDAYGQSMADGTNWGTTSVRDGILPSASQLVNTAGKAGVGMLAGQDATQALTGAGLNLAGITGNNTLKDAGLDPRLAGVATSAGLGLLTGLDPSSIALSSLPALGSYAGGLISSSNGTPAQSNSGLSNSAEGGYASPMTGGDSPDTTGANNMGLDWTKIFGGNTIPPAGNNPDEWSSPFYDPSPFSDFNMSDYLPSDLGQVAPEGNLPGTNSSWQSLLDSPFYDPSPFSDFNMSDYLPSDLGQVAPEGNLPGTNSSWQSLLDSPINANLSDPSYLGGYGNTADANSGSGLSALLASLGLGGSAAGGAGGVGLGTLLGGALGLGGAYLQGNAATNAANTNANAQIEAAKIAAEAAKFKPIGITTRFGSSNFTKDANGNVIGAGYTLTPEMLAQQNQLMGISGNALTQFGNAQTATAPMGDAAGRMMTLGNQYLATSPQAQAQKYMAEQQALLATGRERDLNQMLTGEFNRGTYGLSVGGTSTGMSAANPRLEALFNAQRQQDLGLASQATQGGMDYAKFGAGMVGSGGDMLRGMYGVQSAAYDPYKTALGGATMIEGLGQNALDSGVNMGKMTSNAQSGQLLAQGMSNAANTMQQANSYSPWGGLLSGASNQMQNYQNQQAQQAQNAQMQGMLSRIWGS